MSDPSPIQASSKLKLEDLVGSGHQILPFTAPFFVIGLALNILFPSVFRVGGPAPFDPQAYAAVYGVLLRHRRALTLWTDVQLQPSKSVYVMDVPAVDVVPTREQAAAVLAALEREHTTAEIEHDVADWFHTV